ncbi:MAG: rod shape-determining protein MreD [Anaeromicrobium sp.]|jgi:rod shape-determining protein MreD|uniref:rod shape-determining protein MreD n=1 Tax=Anaeromicrobium sp. TaxID=1929132 RepID=UPI0025CC4379|nr:rod shape-determining protein MreD [Anaeromicrobium sp.]MCT4594947.1 rod shape-determining protein MreD [Anaeromicrobium sp.]
MAFYVTSLIVVINIVLQSTLLQHFRLFGIIPNTSLLIVISFALIWGNKKGALIGVCVGLLQDILGGVFLGMNGLIYLLIGYNVGIFQRILFKDSYLTPVLFATVSTFLYYMIYYVIGVIIGIDVSFVGLFRNVIFIETVYNSLLSVLIYRFIYNLTNKPFMDAKLRR